MATHTFWGGRSVRSKDLHRFTEGSFPELVKSIYFRPVPLSIRKDAFLALPKDTRGDLKDGPYVTSASFDPEHPVRRKEFAVAVELLCLDLDEDETTATLARDIADFPDTVTSVLSPWNFVVHHTANSRPDAPRLRVIVEAASLPVEAHRNAVALLLQRLGLPDKFSGSTESNNCVLPMYRPVMFLDEEDSPVIAHKIDGRAVTLDDLKELGEDRAVTTSDTYAADFKDDPIGDLDQLPVYGLTVADIREAVMVLDPDMKYKEWLEVAAALKHQFRREEDAREAFDLFDEWSSAGDKYKGREETLYKWRSFRSDAMARRSITVRSLFKMAKARGWQSSKLAAPLQRTFDEWIEQADVDTLTKDGVKMIAAMPEIDPLQETDFIKRLAHALRKVGKRFTPVDLIKEVRRLKGIEKKEKLASTTTEPWLQPYVYLNTLDKFVHTRNGLGSAMTPAAFDRTFGDKMIEAESSEDKGLPPNGLPGVSASNHALNVRGISKVFGTQYAPEHDEAVFKSDGQLVLNTYHRHLVPELNPTKSERVGEIWLKHLNILVGCEKMAATVNYWFAALVQHPGRKIRWAPLIQSAQGVGKTLLAEIIGAAIGNRNVSTVEQSALSSGQWNDWAENAQLVVFEEIKVPGKIRLEVMNRLKTIITNNSIQIVAKFRDSKVERNVANVICFTNFKDAIHLEETDRRYMVIWSPIQTKNQVLQLNATGHFEKVARLAKHGDVLRHYLMNVEIPENFPWDGPAPWTEHTNQLIDESKNRLLREIEDLIANKAEPLIGADVVDYAYLESKTALLAKENHPARHFLMQLGYASTGRHDFDGYRTEVWWNPDVFDLSECLTPDEVLAQRRAKHGTMI